MHVHSALNLTLLVQLSNSIDGCQSGYTPNWKTDVYYINYVINMTVINGKADRHAHRSHNEEEMRRKNDKVVAAKQIMNLSLTLNQLTWLIHSGLILHFARTFIRVER